MTTRMETLNRLEAQLGRLVDGMLARKEGQIEFLAGLNRLDDILVELEKGRNVELALADFLTSHRSWLDEEHLGQEERKRLGVMFSRLVEGLMERGDTGHLKLAEEIKQWSQKLGTGTLRLTLKATSEQVSLADRFYSLLRQEAEEMNILLEERGHLLTCLDDILLSAEAKSDRMYHHLAASLIYFLKLEGYKVEPYIKRLRQIQEKA